MSDRKLELEELDNWHRMYWGMNLPLQMWREEEGDGVRVLNYMPRKERCEYLEDSVSPAELPKFCNNTAIVLRNLANLFEAFGRGEIKYIYYPDKHVDDAREEFAKADDDA